MSEWLSMNFIMAAMIPVLAIWRVLDPASSSPATLSFWGSFSLASILSFLSAYAINYWLVKSKLKHGMMTAGESDMGEHQQHQAGQSAHQHGAHQHGSHHQHGSQQNGDMGQHAGHGGGGHEHEAANVSTAKMTMATLFSIVIFVAAIFIGFYIANSLQKRAANKVAHSQVVTTAS